jgi:tetratricopeptide (TPR) repeat protein
MLLGVSLAAVLGTGAGTALWVHSTTLTEAAEPAPAGPPPEATGGPGNTEPSLPLPPEPPRLADSPEYESCLTLLRSDPEGALSSADAWERRGGGEGARHCIALAQLALGEADRAAERLERLASDSQASNAARAAVYAQAAQAWTLAEQPGRAYAACTLALTLSPTDPALLVDRALAAASLGRYGETLLDLDAALAVDPARPDTLVFRAAALRHLDRQADALQAVQQALALDPQQPEALLERGILKQLKGDTAGARADWQRTVASAPDSPAADLARQNLALNEAGPRRR